MCNHAMDDVSAGHAINVDLLSAMAQSHARGGSIKSNHVTVDGLRGCLRDLSRPTRLSIVSRANVIRWETERLSKPLA